MEILRINGGHRFNLKHEPKTTIVQLLSPNFVALSCRGLTIKPKVLVREGDQVILGQPIIHHKDDPRIKLCSPASGIVHEIRFGPRRYLEAIVIAVQAKSEEGITPQRTFTLTDIPALSKNDVVDLLLNAGLWPYLGVFPKQGLAPLVDEIDAVHVNLLHTEAHSPHQELVLKGKTREIIAGIVALKALAPTLRIYIDEHSHLENELNKFAPVTKVAAKYPADNLGVQAFYAGEKHKMILGAHAELVIDIGHLLLTGVHRTERLYCLAGNAVKQPQHYRSRIGVAVGDLVKGALKTSEDIRLVAGGLFSGEKIRFQDFMAPTTTALQALIEDKARIPLVFFRLGFDRLSLSKAWASGFKKETIHEATTNNNGERRACIQCGYCIDICPVKLMPNLISKSFATKDIEKMQWLNIDECVECGLCSFVCPSKIELVEEIISGKELIRKEG